MRRGYTWVVERRIDPMSPWRVVAMDTEESSQNVHVYLAAKQVELTGIYEFPNETTQLTVHQW